MTSKGKLITLIVLSVALLTAGLALLQPAQPTLATPSMGSDCLKCHSAMPPTKDNVIPSKPAAPAQPPASAPAAQPAAAAQPTITLPEVGDLSNLIGKKVTVLASALNIRSNASIQAQVITSVQKNAILSALEQQSGWLKINYDGVTGWVYGYYVSLAAEQSNVAPTTAAPVSEGTPSLVKIPSINEQAKTSRLGSMHWNFFKENVNNPGDPEQANCISCHSAVRMVDDPKATLTDFLTKGQKYATGEKEDPATGEVVFEYGTATEDGKYVSNNFEGITCRVCHVMDEEGVTLRQPDNTCTQCHGRVFNWTTGSGHHVTNDFYIGHGETYADPSVHSTIGMKCEDCHTMNAVKHDYEPANPEDIVRNANCASCHKSAAELEKAIETTQTTVQDSLTKLNDRIASVKKSIADGKVTDTQNLVAKAQARVNFIKSDLSNGVHNPQFAGKLINEANGYLDQLSGQSTAAVDLGNLMVYSQAQSSKLGNAHWDMLENNIANSADPEQNNCISCHSAVRMVDDSKAQLIDFLKKGEKYATGETEDPVTGEVTFQFSTATEDGKYVKNGKEGITCRVCHDFKNSMQPGVASLRGGDAEKTCGQCHGRTYNWNTGSGHHVELAFFKGQGSPEKEVTTTPSYKAKMGFNCQSCHFMDNTKHDFEPATPEQIAANPNCSSCHTASSVGSLIEGIQEEVQTRIESLKPRLEAAKAFVDKNPTNDAAKETYTQAKAGVTFIESDYSEGVHNPTFARDLLTRSEKLLKEFEAKYK